MISILSKWEGNIEVNGQAYDSKSAHIEQGSSFRIILTPKTKKAVESSETSSESVSAKATEYVITVRQWMTKKSSDGFDFMQKFNDNVPMPLRTMVGTIDNETKGMYHMNLHAELLEKQTQYCLACGKAITNPVSMYFGMGPKCGGHNYVNPFESDEALNDAIETYKRDVLSKITWSGWVAKSAIERKEIKH